MTYEQTLEFLFRQLPMYQRDGKSAFKKDLTNITELTRLLGNPHTNFKSVHIAGTNGKGSCSHMLASVFQEAGYKTGLYTSPHLKDFRERIRINGSTISEREVIEFVQQYEAIFEKVRPSFFEWTVALAFHVFSSENVDIAIIETGLGGRLDSTNIITPEISVITNISFDHTDMLGNSLKEIAGEKAGIIKPGIPVVIGDHSGEKEVFTETAKQKNSPIIFCDEAPTPQLVLETDLLGNYQKKNILTVYFSWQQLVQQSWNISSQHLKKGLSKVVENTGLRGRWEILNRSPYTVADTAHNEEGLKATLKQIQELSYGNLHFVIGFVKDKNINNILKLFPENAKYYFCQAEISRALEHDTLRQFAEKYRLKGNSFSSVREAIEAAKKQAKSNDVLYIGGSNFIVAEAL